MNDDEDHQDQDGSAILHESQSAIRDLLGARDGWNCHLCRRPIERSRKAPHPASPSIDHLVPRSLGGRTRLSNLKLAHWTCNNARGNREVDSYVAAARIGGFPDLRWKGRNRVPLRMVKRALEEAQ